MEHRTIHITGEGKKAFKPDQITVMLQRRSIWGAYEEAIVAAAEYTRLIKQQAASAGIPESSVLTRDFSISPKNTSMKDEHGNYHSRFIGYEAEVGFAIKIDVDNALLSKLLFALRDHKGNISFSYGLKDYAKAKEEVMELAVASAMKKANILSQAAGEHLGKILDIDYSYGQVRFEREEHIHYDCCTSPDMAGPPEVDIDPEELTIKDTVNITWELV